MDIARHHRKLAGAAAEERMSPAVHAVALDVRHGADAGQIEVAADHGHGERAARQERRVALLLGDLGGRAAALHRQEPLAAPPPFLKPSALLGGARGGPPPPPPPPPPP